MGDNRCLSTFLSFLSLSYPTCPVGFLLLAWSPLRCMVACVTIEDNVSTPTPNLHFLKAGLGSSSLPPPPARPVISAHETPDGGRLPYPIAVP